MAKKANVTAAESSNQAPIPEQLYSAHWPLVGGAAGVAGVVGLVCAPFIGGHGAWVGLATFAVTLVAVVVYRERHQPRRVTLIALAVLLVAATLAAGWYRSRTLGFERRFAIGKTYTQGSEIFADMRPEIDEAKLDMLFYGMGFHITADRDQERLIAALKRGVHIRFLVFDPAVATDVDFARRTIWPTDTGGLLYDECLTGVRHLLTLVEQYESLPRPERVGRLEIRLARAFPTFRAYVFDANASGVAYFIPYITGRQSDDVYGYRVALRGDFGRLRYEAADQVWNEAQPLDDWADTHEALINRVSAGG